MATNFPASLDSLTNPTSSDSLNSPSHSAQHANVNDAVEALQAKVGADSSAVTSSLDYKVAQLEAISHGKILQVVRATDTTDRNTTSTSFQDSGISVTITPTSATSTIIVIWSFRNSNGVGSPKRGQFQILHTGSGAIEGAEEANVGLEDATSNFNHVTMVGYSSPATTSACEYKGRFKTTAGTVRTDILNASLTGTLWALEVSA